MPRAEGAVRVRGELSMPQLVQPMSGGRQTGQGLAEYALILVLVAVVVIVALQFLGNEVMTMISAVGTSV